MATFVYRPGCEDELREQQYAKHFFAAVAGKVASEVKRIARTEMQTPDRYVNSTEGHHVVGHDGKSVGRVSVRDVAWGFVEFGTRNQPPTAPLRRATEAIVGNFRGSPQGTE